MAPPSTPARTSRPRARPSNTPVQAKHAVTEDAIFNGLDRGRDAVMADTGPVVPCVSLSYFFDNLLPPLRYGLARKIESIQRYLVKEGRIVDGRWEGFPTDPESSGEHEDDTFKTFADIGVYIMEAVQRVTNNTVSQRHQTTKFRCNPNVAPIYGSRNCNSRPDGFALLVTSIVTRLASNPYNPYWDDVAVVGEKKKRDELANTNDASNIRKILWSFNQAMRDSPRRRFMFGYTIENTQMRLWFCSRANILVSEPFNFILEHNHLIRFMLHLMLATPTDLGFDPTVTLVPNSASGGERRYDIIVRSENEDKKVTERTFRTTGVIANIGAEAIRGRGTRVWTVRELINNEESGEEMALKDCWIDWDRRREGDILADIKASATDDEDREIINKHLLSVVCHGDVHIAGKVDNTKTSMRNDTSIPTELKWYELTLPATNTRPVTNPPVGRGIISQKSSKPRGAIEYDDKTHYRIVFKEVAVPLDSLNTASETFYYLNQVFQVLWTLHLCGWVHRDISVANILYINGRGAIVADFEYAQKIDNTTVKPGHARRTGTAYFTSVEVEANKYLFLPNPTSSERPIRPLRRKDVQLLMLAGPGNGARPAVRTQPSLGQASQPRLPPREFRYNPIHDLESFWWLSGYLFMLRKVLQNGLPVDDPVADDRYKKLEEFYVKMCMGQIARQMTLMVNNKFVEGIQYLDPELEEIGTWLENFRGLLVETYTRAEKDVEKIDRRIAEPVYERVLGQLTDLWQSFVERDVELSSIEIDMIAKHAEPKPAPQALSHDTGAALHPKRTWDGFVVGASAPQAGPSSLPAPSAPDLETNLATESHHKRARLLLANSARFASPRSTMTDGLSGDLPSDLDDDDTTGAPSLAAAGSMMSVTTVAGDMSTVPDLEAAGLAISDSTVDNVELRPPSLGPSEQLNARTGARSKGKGKASAKGKGKGKGK